METVIGPDPELIWKRNLADMVSQISAHLIYLGELADQQNRLLETINSTLEQTNYELRQMQGKLGR